MKLTYEALRKDPDLVDRIHAQARHARAEAMHRIAVRPLWGFVARIFGTSPSAHAPRSHLARQG